VKVLALALILAVVLSVGSASLGNLRQAEANVSEKQPVAYIIAKATFEHVRNDTYRAIYQDVEDKRGGRPGDVMVHAAEDACPGEVREDFGCYVKVD
jgi:hypothetical protein